EVLEITENDLQIDHQTIYGYVITLTSEVQKVRTQYATSPLNTGIYMIFPWDPLDTHYVSKKLWYPTLKKANLARRRPYETRHTAAVLHIAAHENPLYISHMLGHSNTKLLFEVYAPYIANASRQDGCAFDALMKESLI
ncbi:hypothetical protein R2R67_24080, partial [Vibrio diabolicus]|nr:hypothetical protein [Vibrio diabolicus]